MRRSTIAAIAVVSTIALTQMASAADLPRKAPAYAPPPPAPVFSWTGFYVGANIGGGWGHHDVDYTPNDDGTDFLFLQGGAPSPTSFTSSGVLGGIQVGYNWQFNQSWLIGFETDFDGSGIKGSGSTSGVFQPYGPLAGNNLPFSATAEERIKWFGTVRGRLGYLPMENLLIFATGGFAYGRVEQNAGWINNANTGFSFGGANTFACSPSSTCFSGSSSDTATGWTVGGGLEYALWQKWTLKAEYLYVSLDSNRVITEISSTPPGDLPSSFNASFHHTNFNVARVGLNYKFGGPY